MIAQRFDLYLSGLRRDQRRSSSQLLSANTTEDGGFNRGSGDAGIRMPANGFIRDVCRLHDGALALSSANVSGGRSPLDISEFSELWPQCEAVFDGGTIRGAGRHGSTIIDLSEAGFFRILRRGDEQLAAQYVQELRAVFRLEQRK